MEYATPQVKTLSGATEMQAMQQQQMLDIWLYVETVAVVAIALVAIVSQIDITP